MFEEVLFAKLNAIAPHVYPIAAPLGFQSPAVVFNRIGTETLDDFDGDGDAAWMTVQIDTYDPTLTNAGALADTIRRTLCSWNDADVTSVSMTDERNWIDTTTQTRLYRVSQDYRIYFAALNAD